MGLDLSLLRIYAYHERLFNLLMERRMLDFNRLLRLEAEALDFIRKAIEKHGDKIYVSCSFGKDSLTLVYLARQIKPDIKVVHANTGVQYPDTEKFKKKIIEEWHLNYTEVNPDISFWEIAEHYGLPTVDKRLCTKWLKQIPIDIFIEENGYEAVLLGTRKDESQMRQASAKKIVKRKTESQTVEYVAYSPILEWLDIDVFEYAFIRGIPLNPIYSKGFERTGCWCCTVGQNVSDQLWRTAKYYPEKFKQLLKYLEKDARFYRTECGVWKYYQIKEHISEDWVKLRVRENLIRKIPIYNMLVKYWNVQIKRAKACEGQT